MKRKRFRIKTFIQTYINWPETDRLVYIIQERVLWFLWVDTNQKFKKETDAIEFLEKANKY